MPGEIADGATGSAPPWKSGCEMRPTCQRLQKDFAAGLMHGRGDALPARHLFGRMDAGRADVTDALRADLGRLGDDQAGARALRVIGDRQWVRHVAGNRAAARHRGHDDAVGELELAEPIRRKQIDRAFIAGARKR
jgi:hypothetical protein